MTNKFGKGVLWCYYRNKIIFSRINIWENTNRKKLEKLEKITKSCVLTLKRLRGQFDPPPPFLAVVFQKMNLLNKGWNLDFLWLFYYHKSHLSWKCHWNSSSRLEDMKNFYFHRFSLIFWIFWHLLVTKKLMMSVYNRWCQHFFRFNILWTDCVTTV